MKLGKSGLVVLSGQGISDPRLGSEVMMNLVAASCGSEKTKGGLQLYSSEPSNQSGLPSSCKTSKTETKVYFVNPGNQRRE